MLQHHADSNGTGVHAVSDKTKPAPKTTKPTPKKELKAKKADSPKPPNKERREWKEIFLTALALSPNVSEAAAAAGMNRSYVYTARKEDSDFAALWDDAIESGVDQLVEAAFERALSESDTLLIFLLKSHRPSVYRETVRGLNINFTPEQIASMTDEEMNAAIAALSKG